MVTRPEDIYPALSEAYNAGDFEALVSIELDLRQPGELAVVIEQTQCLLVGRFALGDVNSTCRVLARRAAGLVNRERATSQGRIARRAGIAPGQSLPPDRGRRSADGDSARS